MLNDPQLEMLKAETLDRRTGAVLKILGVTTILATIVLIYALLLARPLVVHATTCCGAGRGNPRSLVQRSVLDVWAVQRRTLVDYRRRL